MSLDLHCHQVCTGSGVPFLKYTPLMTFHDTPLHIHDTPLIKTSIISLCLGWSEKKPSMWNKDSINDLMIFLDSLLPLSHHRLSLTYTDLPLVPAVPSTWDMTLTHVSCLNSAGLSLDVKSVTACAHSCHVICPRVIAWYFPLSYEFFWG